jgi:hypothetical protein
MTRVGRTGDPATVPRKPERSISAAGSRTAATLRTVGDRAGRAIVTAGSGGRSPTTAIRRPSGSTNSRSSLSPAGSDGAKEASHDSEPPPPPSNTWVEPRSVASPQAEASQGGAARATSPVPRSWIVCVHRSTAVTTIWRGSPGTATFGASVPP